MYLDNNNIQYITLYTGTKGYHNCFCKCPCCSQKNINDIYKGTIKQVYELLNNYPNLKQLYILGNPDPLVDADFCNLVSKIAISRNIKVCYSTSGVGGINRFQRLLDGINPNDVDYISFSIDSINPEKMNYLKGIKYPFESVINTIKWLQEKNFKIKIQPNLWPINYQESYDIIAFFANLGIDWFTFHIGSNETNTLDTHRHLNEEELHEVHRLLDLASKFNVKITCPVIYESLNKDTDYDKKWYCMNTKNSNSLLAFFGEEIYVTNVPILSSIDSKYLYKLGEKIDITELNKSCICPISGSVAKQKTICRYVKKEWN